MPRVHCEKKMHDVLADLEAGLKGVELDVSEECIEEWGVNYAIARVDIMEPDDDLRDVYDLDAAIDKVVAVVVKHFGRSFTVVRGRIQAQTKMPKGARQTLYFRRLGSGWELEIEAHRKGLRPKPKPMTSREQAYSDALDDEGRMGAEMAGEG